MDTRFPVDQYNEFSGMSTERLEDMLTNIDSRNERLIEEIEAELDARVQREDEIVDVRRQGEEYSRYHPFGPPRRVQGGHRYASPPRQRPLPPIPSTRLPPSRVREVPDFSEMRRRRSISPEIWRNSTSRYRSPDRRRIRSPARNFVRQE